MQTNRDFFATEIYRTTVLVHYIYAQAIDDVGVDAIVDYVLRREDHFVAGRNGRAERENGVRDLAVDVAAYRDVTLNANHVDRHDVDGQIGIVPHVRFEDARTESQQFADRVGFVETDRESLRLDLASHRAVVGSQRDTFRTAQVVLQKRLDIGNFVRAARYFKHREIIVATVVVVIVKLLIRAVDVRNGIVSGEIDETDDVRPIQHDRWRERTLEYATASAE